MPFPIDVAIIGGGGHVGLPLALTFADCGLRTVAYDIDAAKVASIAAGRMPFIERGGPETLRRTLDSGKLTVTDDSACLAEARHVVCIVGTPVDEHLNPSFSGIRRTLADCREHFRAGQILVLRSTVYPGTSAHLQQWFDREGLDVAVAFCPERVAQGYSLEEFRTLPQLVSAFDEAALAAVRELFARFVPEMVEMAPLEAELCKLMTNAWRYLQFAAVNQFYMVASGAGVDFGRILHGCRHNYPRMAGMPGPGLTAGPCLVKDTMQLAAFSHNQFMLGHAAMLINEGLPAHLIELAKDRIDLAASTAGILGLAFKGQSDDPRDSLSYKLRKLLEIESAAVLSTDPFVPDPQAVPLARVVAESDVLFLATPHVEYRTLAVPSCKVVIDCWNWLPPQDG